MEYIWAVHTSKKITSKGVWDSKVETKNRSLWLLLHWHALQENCFVIEQLFSSFLERITLRIGNDGWPNRKRQFIGVILEIEKQLENRMLDWTSTIHKRHICSHPEREPLQLADPS